MPDVNPDPDPRQGPVTAAVAAYDALIRVRLDDAPAIEQIRAWDRATLAIRALDDLPLDDLLSRTVTDWCHDHDADSRPGKPHVWLDGHNQTVTICPPEGDSPA